MFISRYICTVITFMYSFYNYEYNYERNRESHLKYIVCLSSVHIHSCIFQFAAERINMIAVKLHLGLCKTIKWQRSSNELINS